MGTQSGREDFLKFLTNKIYRTPKRPLMCTPSAGAPVIVAIVLVAWHHGYFDRRFAAEGRSITLSPRPGTLRTALHPHLKGWLSGNS